MAATDYIKNISEYLADGKLSDLTLAYGEVSWQVHKIIVCCHSKWFQTAITGDFKEASSQIIPLQDEPELGDALDCMVSYFYHAKYEDKYETSTALLHAQVAAIADKYDCPSLYKLASTRLNDSMEKIKDGEWFAVADFVYSHFTTDDPAHVELHRSVVAAFARRLSLRTSALRNEDVVKMLRENADLATDLLLSGPQARNVSEQVLVCNKCHYVHFGRSDCSQIIAGPESPFNRSPFNSPSTNRCPKCGTAGDTMAKRVTLSVRLFRMVECLSCDGAHTADDTVPETEYML